MFEGFNNLPLFIQYAVAIGAGLGGATFVIWRFMNLKSAAHPELDLTQQFMIRTAELDNQSLRNELIEVVRISRESIQQRLDQSFIQMNTRIDSIEGRQTKVEDRQTKLENKVQRLQLRRH